MSEKVAACPCPLKRVFAQWKQAQGRFWCAALIHVTVTYKILHGASTSPGLVSKCYMVMWLRYNHGNTVEPGQMQQHGVSPQQRWCCAHEI